MFPSRRAAVLSSATIVMTAQTHDIGDLSHSLILYPKPGWFTFPLILRAESDGAG